METVKSVTKAVFVLTMLAVLGYYAYELTVWNYYTAEFVRVIVGGGLSSQEEVALMYFIFSALVAPSLIFLLFLALLCHEWRDLRSPEGLRARAEALQREADAVEQYREQRSRVQSRGVL